MFLVISLGHVVEDIRTILEDNNVYIPDTVV
jgi:hypothetical protein